MVVGTPIVESWIVFSSLAVLDLTNGYSQWSIIGITGRKIILKKYNKSEISQSGQSLIEIKSDFIVD